jgi:hypothetical protein
MMSDPKISIRLGRTQIVVRGRAAINAAGWTLRFLLFTGGVAFLVLAVGMLAFTAALRW